MHYFFNWYIFNIYKFQYIFIKRKSNWIYYNNVFRPKISFIATVFNKEKYLNSFICSIQQQYLNEFELIIVDDCSIDKSVEIINFFKSKDRRIKLLRNKQNMHSLYSRFKGVIFSRGKYISFVDSDDIILKEGLINSYNYIKNNDLDMVQFNSILETKDKIWINRRCYKYLSIIYQPILSYIYYYNNNKGIEINYYLWDKLIKKKVVFKSLYYIGLKFLHKKIIIENDVVLLFSLFRNANSFQYIDELGYYSNRNNADSVFNSAYDLNKSNQIIYSIFSNIEFLYDKTENTKFSKYFCIFKLHQGYNRYITNYITLNDKIKIKNLSQKISWTNLLNQWVK